MTRKSWLAAFVLSVLVALGLAWWLRRGADVTVDGAGRSEIERAEIERDENGRAPGSSENRVLPEHVREVVVASASVDSPSAPGPLGTLLVHLTQGDERRALADLPVRIQRSAARSIARSRSTGADGIVRFEQLEPGTWGVRCPLGGQKRVQVAAGALVNVELTLPAGSPVAGVVVDGEDRPIPAAEVWISEVFGEPSPTAIVVTDSAGRFALESRGNAVAIGARAAGFAPGRSMHLPDSDDLVTLTLRRTSSSIRGAVIGESGSPIVGALVQLSPVGAEDEAPVQLTSADAEGRFAFDAVWNGPCLLRAAAAGLAIERRELDVAPGAEIEVELRLMPGGSVRGRALGADLQPLAGVHVQLQADDGWVGLWARTGEDGQYRLDGLPRGRLLLRASAGELGEDSVELDCDGACELSWDPRIGKSVGIFGYVYDDRRVPAAALDVVAVEETPSSQRGDVRQARTDAQGRFEFRDLRKVSYRLDVRDSSGVTVAIRSGVRAGDGPIELELVPTNCGILGRVVSKQGEPLAGVNVLFHRTGGGALPGAKTDAAGAFEATRLPAGEYSVVFHRKDFVLHQTERVQVLAGEDVQIETVELEPSGSVRVRCVPASAATVEVRLLDASGNFSASRSLAAEEQEIGCRFEGLPLAPLSVEVWLDGVRVGESVTRPARDGNAEVSVPIRSR